MNSLPDGSLARLFAVLALCAVIYHVALIARSAADMYGRPLTEDAYYSLSVARTLGEGGGISVNGVEPTNGVQPLICFFYAAIFALTSGDTLLAIRLVLLLQIGFYVVAAFAVGWFASALTTTGGVREEMFWLATGLMLVSYTISIYSLNGLETGMSIAFTFGCTAFYIERIARARSARMADFARLGALLGLGILARIDITFLVASIAAWHVTSAAFRRGGTTSSSPLRAIGEAAVLAAVALVVSLPWWLYNQIQFGSVMPISGLAQQNLIVDRPESVGIVLRLLSDCVLIVVHMASTAGAGTAYAGLWLLLATAALAAGYRPFGNAVRAALRGAYAEFRLRPAVPLLLHVVALTVYYTFFFGAPHFLGRYLQSLRIVATLAVASVLYMAWRTAPHGKVRSLGGAAVVAATLVSFVALTVNFTQTGISWNVQLVPSQWISQHAGPSDRVAMFQTGTSGFFNRQVVNLDGKVNPAAGEAFRNGTLPLYVDSSEFDYIIDWDFFTRHIFVDPHVRSHYVPIDTLKFDFVVWRRTRHSRTAASHVGRTMPIQGYSGFNNVHRPR